MADAARTWILTGSPENSAATAARGFSPIGGEERRRNQAMRMEPGAGIVLHLTRAMRFAASVRVTGEVCGDRLAVQDQPRTVSQSDAALLPQRMHATAGASA